MVRVSCIDQTVNEGLRLAVNAASLDVMIQTLVALAPDRIDVGVAEWKKQRPRSDEALLQRYLRGKIGPLCSELYEAHRLGFRRVLISYHPDSGKPAGEEVCAVLANAGSLPMDVSLCVENASQLPVAELASFQSLAKQFHLKTFAYGDSASCLDPFRAQTNLQAVAAALSCPLEFHAHNALGLATANTLGAIRAGVRQVATAVAGVGKNGSAPWEEVILAGAHILPAGVKPTPHLAAACTKILSCLGLKLPDHKAVIGMHIFDHESGLHVDGVTKNPAIYESFSPEEVGLVRRLVIGKHSGTASLQAKFREWNVILNETDAHRLLKKVRKTAVRQKGPLADEQIKTLYCAGAGES